MHSIHIRFINTDLGRYWDSHNLINLLVVENNIVVYCYKYTIMVYFDQIFEQLEQLLLPIATDEVLSMPL